MHPVEMVHLAIAVVLLCFMLGSVLSTAWNEWKAAGSQCINHNDNYQVQRKELCCLLKSLRLCYCYYHLLQPPATASTRPFRPPCLAKSSFIVLYQPCDAKRPPPPFLRFFSSSSSIYSAPSPVAPFGDWCPIGQLSSGSLSARLLTTTLTLLPAIAMAAHTGLMRHPASLSDAPIV